MDTKFVRLLAVGLFVASTVWAAHAGEMRTEKVLGGKVELSVPTEFSLMSDEWKHLKYPSGNPPDEVYTDERGTVNIAAAIRAYPGNSGLDALVAGMVSGIDKVRKISIWHDKGTREIGGRKFGFLEFTAPTLDSEVYNYIYFTKDADRLLLFTINSTTEKLPTWKDTLKKVVDSTRVK